MDKESALEELQKEFHLSWHKDYDKLTLIETLYSNGYVICSPEDMEKINGMTALAEVHGMNPFNPNHVVKEKE